MCCCRKPTINGENGYSWDSKTFGVRPISAPELEEGDKLIFDEPGRCGGQDSHCHHYRVVHEGLLVRHGGGTERLRLSNEKAVVLALSVLDSNGRYWLLNAIYHAASHASSQARAAEAGKWRQAAAEKRIKTRKLPARGSVKVWIEDAGMGTIPETVRL